MTKSSGVNAIFQPVVIARRIGLGLCKHILQRHKSQAIFICNPFGGSRT